MYIKPPSAPTIVLPQKLITKQDIIPSKAAEVENDLEAQVLDKKTTCMDRISRCVPTITNPKFF